jgi:hypothetical protein
MSTAESLITGAQNYATTHAANAATHANVVYSLVNLLMGKRNIEVPDFNVNIAEALGPVDVGPVPEFDGQYVAPGSVPTAPDIKSAVEDAYNNADPVTQAALTAAIDAWLTAYAPGYKAAITKLQNAIDTGITTGQALSDDAEQAIYNRAAQRIRAETNAQVQQATRTMRKRGFELPQVVLSGAINRVNQASGDRLAQSATETAIRRAELEIQHKQFCLGQSAQIQQFVQSAFLQFAGIVANLKEHSIRYASMVADMLSKTYDAEVKAFETTLRAAVANLNAAVDSNRAEISAYVAGIDAKIKQKQLEYDRIRVQLAAAELPFKGELETNMKEAELQMEGLRAAASAAAAAANAMADIAGAAMSGINGIASITTEED